MYSRFGFVLSRSNSLIDMSDVSVILPIRDGETEVEHLLENLPKDKFEIILSKSTPLGNRATSLNSGAKQAKGEFLWFLHADTRFSTDSISKLIEAIQNKPNHLHYFRLKFYPKSFMMKFNAIGANIRSKLLGCPYGDQGFCIQKEIFFKIGMYEENVTYGEDHLFVWKARRLGISLNRINSYVYTSDRKYRNGGWFKITCLHQYLFWKQATPEILKYLKNK